MISSFQSTLPREERPFAPNNLIDRRYFNPRSHERSDQCVTCHAHGFLYFNPRSHERSDGVVRQRRPEYSYFNPRSHERSDLFSLRTSYSYFNFNPRSHERSDPCIQALKKHWHISIHAPTRGATLFISSYVVLWSFQSTLPREERPS